MSIGGRGSASCKVSLPEDSRGKSVHIVLELRDSGSPSLYAYRRAIIDVR